MKIALAALAVFASASCSLAGFVNTTITFQEYYPTPTAPVGTTQTKTVNPTATFTGRGNSYTVRVTDTAVEFFSNGSSTFFSAGGFNGFTLSSAGLTGLITGGAIALNANFAGLDASRLTFTGTALAVNLQGLTLQGSPPTRLNVTFANATGPAVAPLPVPLLAGVGLLGGTGLLRRRRGVAA